MDVGEIMLDAQIYLIFNFSILTSKVDADLIMKCVYLPSK